jgi:predicted acetyltransferase
MAVEVRACAPDEVLGALNGIWHYFGKAVTEDDVERFRPVLPHERVHAAWVDGQIVGGAGAYLFETTVPGARQVPTAGVMGVGVLPTHRRRGALSALMRAQLADAHERGEPLATLYASEGGIYGRYGYGLASLAGMIGLPKEHARLRPGIASGTPRLLGTQEEALELLPPTYDSVQARTTGMFTRTVDWWKTRRFYTPPWRQGAEQMRVVIEFDGRPEAYAIYRLSFGAKNLISQTELEVIEALGTTPEALGAVWRYLLELDWTASIRAELLPLDQPLFLWLVEPRRMGLTVSEAVWVRLVDVAAALSARGYEADGAVVFDVRDETCPWNAGRWRLEDGAAARTDEAADLALDVRELGSVYLGGFTFAELHRAGLVEELKAGAVERADALFRTDTDPWCPEIF